MSASLTYDEWVAGSSLLPRPTSSGAIGYDPSNNTIWLLGGENGGFARNKQLISFDYRLNTFKDYTSTILSQNVFGYSQNYAQIGSTLYTDYDGSFNMKTITFTSNDLSPPLDFSGLYGCMLSIRNEYLVFIDGDIVQILNIESKQWLNSVPSLQMYRRMASCNYVNDKMFIIGGMDNDRYSSIEYLNVSTTSMMDLESTSWTYNIDSLPQPISSSRSIAVNDDIFVIGGISDGIYLNTVYIIDGITGSVSLGGYLYKAVSRTCLSFVDGIIYSFGGDTGSSTKWDGWQMISINTSTSTETTAVFETTPVITSASTTHSTNSMTTPFQYTTSDPITSIIETLIQTPNHESISINQNRSNDASFETSTIFEDHTTTSVILGTIITALSSDANEERDSMNSDNVWFILVGITLSIFVIFILCGAIWIWIKKRKKPVVFVQMFEASSKNMVMNERPKPEDNNKNTTKQTIELAETKTVKGHNVLEMKNDIKGEGDSSSTDSMYDMEGIEPEPDTTTNGNTDTEMAKGEMPPDNPAQNAKEFSASGKNNGLTKGYNGGVSVVSDTIYMDV